MAAASSSIRTWDEIDLTIRKPSAVGGNAMVHDLLPFPVPMELLSFTVAARRHHHRHRVAEPRLDASVRRPSAAHAPQPVIGVLLQIVVLMERSQLGATRDRHGFRRGLSGMQVENDVRLPPAPRFRDEPPLRATFATRRVE